MEKQYIEVVSNCCGAPLLPIETDICAQCFEHCDLIELI